MKKAHDFSVLADYAPPEEYVVLQRGQTRGAPLAHYRRRAYPLEAALEEEFGFIFYDTVLTVDEKKRWEDAYGQPYVCKLRQVARAVTAHERVFVQSANGTGKTYLAGEIAAYYPLLFPDEEKKNDYGAVWVGTAPPENNLGKIFGYVTSRYLEHPHLFTGFTLKSNYLKSRRNPNAGTEGQAFTQTGDESKKIASWKGKHAPHQIIIIDEADGVEDIFWTAIETCLTGEDEHLLALFNPNAAVGQVYDWVARSAGCVITISAFDHPNVITGENRIPGAVSRADVVYEIASKSREAHPDELGAEYESRLFRVPAFLDGASCRRNERRYGPLHATWRLITDGRLATKVLGRYPAQSVQRLFADEWIDAARSRYDAYVARYGERPPAAVAGRLGIDPSEGGEGDKNAAVKRFGGFVMPPVTQPGANVNEIGAWAAGLMRSRHAPCNRAFVDAISYGQGTAHTMRDGYTYHPEGAARPIVVEGVGKRAVFDVKVSERPREIDTTEDGSFALLRDFLAWQVRKFVEHDPLRGVYSAAMLPPDEMLIRTMRVMLWWTNGAGLICTSDKKYLRARLGGASSNAFDALAATFMPETDEAETMTGAALMPF